MPKDKETNSNEIAGSRDTLRAMLRQIKEMLFTALAENDRLRSTSKKLEYRYVDAWLGIGVQYTELALIAMRKRKKRTDLIEAATEAPESLHGEEGL